MSRTFLMVGLAVACAHPLPQKVALVEPAGAPAGWKRHVIADGTFTWTAVVADFTGDGKPDVISGDRDRKRTMLYVGPDWQPIEIYQGVTQLHSATFDVDGDGDPDYLGGQFQPGLVFWLERPGDPLHQPWKFREIDSSARGGVDGVHGMTIADVDGDGKPDLVSNSNQPKGPVADSVVYYGIPADPHADAPWPRVSVAAGDAPGFNHYMGVGDLDGDGQPEIATGAKLGHYFAYWTRTSDIARPWTKHLLPGNQQGATNIVVADVDGNGHNDLVASRGHGQGVLWFEGPAFTSVHAIDPTLIGPHALAVADLDGDGDLDVAIATTTSATVAWFQNDGRGQFVRQPIFNGQSAYDLRLSDLDGDGDLDMVLAGQESRNLVWFQNPTR